MKSNNHAVIETLCEWLKGGHDVWLCTVLETWGSSPRPAGSLMACRDDGRLCGSLSGGCIEDDLIDRFLEGFFLNQTPTTRLYGVNKEDASRFGLPCGGQLSILIEHFTREDLQGWQSLYEATQNRTLVKRTIDLDNAEWHWDFCNERYNDAIETHQSVITHWIGSRYRLLLIGATHVAEVLAQTAPSVEFDVLICDPRTSPQESWTLENVPIDTRMPDDALRAWLVDSRCAVVTLAHDPRVDDMALMEALNSDAFYIGALGSTRTSAKRRERLKLLDLSDHAIDRLHAPVGIEIGSKAPAEIAIAILADLIRARSKR